MPEAIEKKMIREALENSDWNQSEAARELKMNRNKLIRRMKKYKIQQPE